MKTLSPSGMQDVYIVDSIRTPFLKSTGAPGPFSASDLAVRAGAELILRYRFAASDLAEVIVGCMMPSSKEANIGRVVALRLGCGHFVPAWTVQRNCASGLQALDSAAKDIATGRADLVLAGGTETMSRAPLLFRPKAVAWFSRWQKALRRGGRLSTLLALRPYFFAPQIALLDGLTDHTIGMSMPQTAEYLAHQFAITRQDMDSYAVMSQQRAAAAQEKGLLAEEIVPLLSAENKLYQHDDGIRANSDLEALAKLKPILDRRFGLITAGNSSQISDGAAMMLLASEAAVERYGLPVRGRIIDVQWSGVDPAQMGIGPIAAISQLLARYEMQYSDIDYWEINEAFAGQVLACLQACDNPDYAKAEFKNAGPFGGIDLDRLNIDGGAIALGHPVGASGARIAGHVLRVLQRQNGRYGIASLCIGGGQGGAMLIERIEE